MVNKEKKSHQTRTLKHIKLKKINWVAILVAVLVTGIAWASWVALEHRTNQANLTKKLNAQQVELEKKIEEAVKANKSVDELKKEQERLNKELQAKRAKAVAYAEPIKKVFGGDCASWMAGAGITDTANAMILIRKESNCNPRAVNRSSGACGVAQELPCGKSGCQLGDGACQVKWMNGYVAQRYGSWANAVAWHRSHNWY